MTRLNRADFNSVLGEQARRPHIALTLGDPAGIGPEVILKALADPAVIHGCDVTVVGTRAILEKIYRHLLALGPEFPLADPDQLAILEVELDPVEVGQIALGQSCRTSGMASFRYMEVAIAQALAGNFQAIVTGPIAKSSWKAAGFDYPGQTELLAERAGVEQFGMLFVARSPHTGWTLRTLLATTHIPLNQVSQTLTPALMTQKLDLLVDCLQQDFGLDSPRIVVAGLNPHSGEQGQLGQEEQTWLIPWLEQMRDRLPNVKIDGPIPPDTLWVKPGQAWFGVGTTDIEPTSQPQATRSKILQLSAHTEVQNPADAYLALYHDQGLIPVKLMAFDRAVNTTIGLPFVRTSPDHGTAFDIANRGIADATSMKAAIQTAVELCQTW